MKDIYVKKMKLHTMKWAFWMLGDYGSHADNKYDPHALPEIKNINFRDVVAEDVAMAGRLVGISKGPFTGICIANATIGMTAKRKNRSWSCVDVHGITSGVTPPPCHLLHNQGLEKINACDFPERKIPIDNLELKKCTSSVELA